MSSPVLIAEVQGRLTDMPVATAVALADYITLEFLFEVMGLAMVEAARRERLLRAVDAELAIKGLR